MVIEGVPKSLIVYVFCCSGWRPKDRFLRSGRYIYTPDISCILPLLLHHPYLDYGAMLPVRFLALDTYIVGSDDYSRPPNGTAPRQQVLFDSS